MNLFNIGGEGQLFVGAIVGAAARASRSAARRAALSIPAMIVAGAVGGAALALDPGRAAGVLLDERDHHLADAQLRRRARPQLPDLRLASRTGATRRRPSAKVFPQGKTLPDAATLADLPTSAASCVPLGFLLAIAVAARRRVLYARTRFGFEVQVIGDSPRAARYAGMRTRRKILAVMALSGAIAGIGGASQDGDFRHLLDPRGLTAAGLRLRRDRDRGARALQPVRRRASSRSCSAACRTRATRCRAPTSRPASSASCRA